MSQIFANEARVRLRDGKRSEPEDDAQDRAEEEERIRRMVEWRKGGKRG